MTAYFGLNFIQEPGELYVSAGKRLAITSADPVMGDWVVSYSPRNSNNNAEGPWCQWVHLAREILAHDKTRAEMPDHYLEYPDPPHLHSEHHPDCAAMPAEDFS